MNTIHFNGWDTDDKQPSVNMVPLWPDRQEMLMNLEGPPDTSPEAKALEHECGFPYKSMLGELIYPFVLCRVDIGFATGFLARFSKALHVEHFHALKNMKYLHRTCELGIVYRRSRPDCGATTKFS